MGDGAAAPNHALAIEADLIGFRGVDALQADPLVTDRDGVGVDNVWCTGQGLGVSREAAGDDNDCQDGGAHNRLVAPARMLARCVFFGRALPPLSYTT